MTPGTYTWLEWGTATGDPRSQVLDHAGAMIFTGSTVRRAGTTEDTPPGRIAELIDTTRVRVAWADGTIDTEDAAALRSVARPAGVAGPTPRAGGTCPPQT